MFLIFYFPTLYLEYLLVCCQVSFWLDKGKVSGLDNFYIGFVCLATHLSKPVSYI